MGLNKSCLFNAARYSILDMEYGVQISGIGGWGAELNREIVSCRACVRGVYVSQESSATRVRLMGSLEVTPGRNKYDVGSCAGVLTFCSNAFIGSAAAFLTERDINLPD